MSDRAQNNRSLPNFSQAFQQMASFVAIAKTRNAADVLDELVLQCFVILPEERFGSPLDIVNAIHVLFGIRLPETHVALAINRLTSRGRLVSTAGDKLSLGSGIREALEVRVADAKRLEERQSRLACTSRCSSSRIRNKQVVGGVKRLPGGCISEARYSGGRIDGS